MCFAFRPILCVYVCDAFCRGPILRRTHDDLEASTMSDDVMNPFLDDDDELYEANVDVKDAAVSDEVAGDSKPWERDYTDEERADMKARASAGEVLPGHKKHRTTYHRRDVTDKDLDLLAFIARFKYSTEQQLTLIADVQRRTVYKRLMGLSEMKLVNVFDVPGARRLWMTTQRAHVLLQQSGRILGDEVRLMKEKDIALDQLAHTLAVNQTAAWLLRGLPLSDDSSAWLRLPYAMKSLLSEYQVRRGWEQLMNANDTSKQDRGIIGARRREEVERAVKDGKIKINEVHEYEPSLWTLSDKNAKGNATKQFHYPDLVVNRESLRDGAKPESIAFEIELTAKNRGETARILRMFKNDTMTYKHVVWVVQSDAVGRHIKREDREVGLERDGRMSFIPLVSAEGTMFTDRPWRL